MTHQTNMSQTNKKGGRVMRRRVDKRAVGSAIAIPFILGLYIYMSTFLTNDNAGFILYLAILAITGGLLTFTLGYLINKSEGGNK